MATRAQSEQQGATSLDTLDAEITAQNDVLNKLRLSGAPSEEVDRAKAKLGELKKARAVLTGQVGKEREKKKGKDKEKGKEAEEAGRLLLKTAKVESIGNQRLWSKRNVLPVTHREDGEGHFPRLWRGVSRHARVRTQGRLDWQVRRRSKVDI